MRYLTLSFLLLCALVTSPVRAEDLADALRLEAPDADPVVLRLAQQAMTCALASGIPASERLAVIDYSRPSTSPRLWVFDLNKRSLLFHELVAHGKNSGENLTTHFSNEDGSLSTSIGLFLAQESYHGENGYSLRMDGLEPGFNDNARERAIVIHGASYVNEDAAATLGRLGRSWGCPAVRTGIAKRLIDTLKGGQFLFSYYPDQKWLTSSRFLNCKNTTTQIRTR